MLNRREAPSRVARPCLIAIGLRLPSRTALRLKTAKLAKFRRDRIEGPPQYHRYSSRMQPCVAKPLKPHQFIFGPTWAERFSWHGMTYSCGLLNPGARGAFPVAQASKVSKDIWSATKKGRASRGLKVLD